MNDELFAELVESVHEGGRILRGEATPSREFTVQPLDVKAIRERQGLSQTQFARLLGISVRTLQNWEQGRRVPEGPARVLLLVAGKHPDAIWAAVKER
ncbi:MAG: helix-turn-helix domain-containing protein [Ardenticatenaceae bacterium]|nr:helix-turn-helix domain-containing protein [Ardenticatenaceae bacterium]